MNKKKKKTLTIYVLGALVVMLGIAYAILNSDLNIAGDAAIKSANWDVHFDNVVVNEGSVDAETPEIKNSEKNLVEYNVTLNNPGDYFEFTVDVVNDGTIDAMLSDISSRLNGSEMGDLPAYLDYYISYGDKVDFDYNHLLKAGDVDTYLVHIGYNKDIGVGEIPPEAQTLNLSFSTTYVQADENAVERDKVSTKYYVGGDSISIGEIIGVEAALYDSPDAAMSDFGHAFFTKQLLLGQLVQESYVGFNKNETMYYLKGGVDESDLSSKPIYEANKNTLLNAFGADNCSLYDGYYSCSSSNLNASAYENGHVAVDDDSFSCLVNTNGYSYCEGI